MRYFSYGRNIFDKFHKISYDLEWYKILKYENLRLALDLSRCLFLKKQVDLNDFLLRAF